MSADAEAIRRHIDSLGTPDSLVWIGVPKAFAELIEAVSRAADENWSARASLPLVSLGQGEYAHDRDGTPAPLSGGAA